MSAADQSIQHWQTLLTQYRASVQKLREQLAQYGAGEERLATLNQLDAAFSNIQEAKAALRSLGGPIDHLPGEPDEIEAFPPRFVEEFPHPIAIACQRFNLAAENVERFRRLDELLWDSVKYLTAIALAQYRADSPQEAQLRGWLGGLSHGNLQAWVAILDGICADYRNRDPLPRVAGELLAGYDLTVGDQTPIARAHRHFVVALGGKKALRNIDATTPQLLLAQLVIYRAKQWEAHDPDANQAQKLLFILQPALQQLLETFGLIAKYRLRYLERADRTKAGWVYTVLNFQGCEEVAKPLDKPFQEANGQEKPTYTLRRLYLCASNEQPLLNLHPILIAYHYALYFLEYNQSNQQIRYRPCGPGEMYDPPAHIKSVFLSALEPLGKENPEEDSIDNQLEQTTNQVEEEENKDRFKQMPSDVLLTYLSDEGQQALKIALGEAIRIGRFWLGVEFLLMGLSKQEQGVFSVLLHEIGLEPGEVRGALRSMVGVVKQDQNWRQQDVVALGAAALPQLRQVDATRLRQEFGAGGEQQPVYTPRVQRVLEAAQVQAGGKHIGHAQLLWAIFQEPQALAVQIFFSLAHEQGWSPKQVMNRLAALVGAKPAAAEKVAEQVGGVDFMPPPPSGPHVAVKPATGLARYGRDLTAEAQAGKLHPAVGESARQAMLQMGRILLQREANNPLLIGDPGVGKSAIVEGFAWRLAGKGDKPVAAQLAGRRVIEISANSLTAGTKYRGELESRVEQLLAQVKAAEGQVILFIDEIHSILASGGSNGVADALKPALARGELPCIGATTVTEYQQHIEKDGALARRFTPVWLEEPSEKEAIEIVSQVAAGHLGKERGVTFASEAIVAAVRLADRYILEERLPGKAIKLLDQAASGRVIGGSLSGLGDVTAAGGGMVTVDDILEVVAGRTNIPVSQLGKTDKQRLLELEDKLRARIIGQDEAVGQVVRLVRRAGAGLTDPKRPQGVLLLAGPTGVGKTELALALAEALFDQEAAICRLDMSEFMEKHQVARLIGAPPGYVGYAEEGQLTGRLRRQPYSVVLLDEMEKAHADVQHLFLQLFDAGRLTDAQSRVADGRRAIFVMTTNLGAKEATGFESSRKSYEEKLLEAIRKHFSPEFVNRIDRILCFNPLDETALLAIFEREFGIVQKRLQEEKQITLKLPEAAKKQLVAQAARQQQGARPLRRLIEDQILGPMVDKLLAGDVTPGTQVTINLAPEPGGKVVTPKFDLSPEGLGDFGLPRPGRVAPPVRPASPEAGLPHLEGKDAAVQQRFDACYLALATHLFDQGIALEITAFAKKYFFPPLVESLRIDLNLPIAEMFERLIDEPLSIKLLAQEFKAGDWVVIDVSTKPELIFRKGGEKA